MRQDDVIERALEQQHRKHDGNMAFSISFPIPQMNTIRRKEGCHLVQEEVRAAVDETRTCKSVGMKQQGAWTRWENAVERKVTWAEFWKVESHHIKFLVQAVYDVLPSPSKLLHTWGKAEAPLYSFWLFPLYLLTFCFYQSTNLSTSAKHKQLILQYFRALFPSFLCTNRKCEQKQVEGLLENS